MPKLPALLALASLATLAACGPDGCGSDPNAAPAQEQQAPSAGGGGGGGHAGGGETIKLEGQRKAPEAKDTKDSAAAAEAKGKPAPKSEKGVPAAPEYSAAGKPLDAPAAAGPAPLAAMRLVFVCRKSEPACGSASAALADARKAWGARVVVEKVDAEKGAPPEGLETDPLPAWGLYRGSERVSVRQGAPFEPKRGRGGEPLENEVEYRKRLTQWLKAGVEAGDLNRAR